jgi:hypothetical protein
MEASDLRHSMKIGHADLQTVMNEVKEEIPEISLREEIEEHKTLSLKYMFKPNDIIKTKWDFLIMTLAVFNCITIPLKVAPSTL